jgi:glycosyltransferase involved in cell wall biosynthesis
LAQNPIQVFVHLAYGFGADNWEQRWKQGKIIGLNDSLPYGYYHANEFGCTIVHSQDKPETAIEKLWRLGIRAILGFDLIHAWRNFDNIRNADVVWTHTESQYLAILLLLQLTPRTRRPKLIAQSVWLFDRWNKFSALRRRFFSKLIEQADVLTVHSPLNLARAKQLFPHVPSELVLYGIAAEEKLAPAVRLGRKHLRILSVGNDEHRDWSLLIDTVRDQGDWTIKIASQKVKPSSIGEASNIEIVRPTSNDELFALYRWADVLVLAIKPNLHASGITVIQEACLRGVPVICSATGGLNAYFSDSEVRYVPPQDSAALLTAINSLASDNDGCRVLASNAQARMGPTDLSSISFARRHAEISKRLLEAGR